jgi:hypothetical protein
MERHWWRLTGKPEVGEAIIPSEENPGLISSAKVLMLNYVKMQRMPLPALRMASVA